MAHKTEFLYLSEPDTIAAGVLDVPKCINNAEEVFTLLAKGDYLMGGNNHNNHGMYIVFPKESPFPNMPVAGPDRRFVAMPAYLGGRFDICGQKWYGSNAANKSKGLPRSVLMVTLNNKDTGEPLAYMSANLLSAARTGAVPGVATRHLARKDAEVLLCIGCGVISQWMLIAVSAYGAAAWWLVVYSMALPITALTIPLLMKTLFGYRGQDVSGSMGLAMVQAANMIANPIVGMLYDRNGSYVPGYYIGILVDLIAAVVFAAGYVWVKRCRKSMAENVNS